MIESLIGILANILSIFDIHIDIEKVTEKLKDKKIRIISIVLCISALLIYFYISKQLSITVTQVILNEDTLHMSTDDTNILIATVLYSDNSTNNNVLWSSSNESVAIVGEDGLITALTEGTTTIVAQATKNNSTESAMCIVTVKNPPSGYSISVRQTNVDSYAYVYIKPYDNDITRIQIYGKSPSGEIFPPATDENNLYRFYTECGTWTIYATIENEAGLIYEAQKPEDFVTIEVTDISSSFLNDILPQFIFP